MKRINVPTLSTGILSLTVGLVALALHFGFVPSHLTQQLFAACLILAGLAGLAVALKYRNQDRN